jgi:hypothetical protein
MKELKSKWAENPPQNKVDTFSCTQPCSNCPYRTDAPLKLWHRSEFKKLLESENKQFGSVYKCHKNNGSVCVGWLMKQLENGCPSIQLRLSIIQNKVGKEYFDKLNSPAPLYKTVKQMIRANYPSIKPLAEK